MILNSRSIKFYLLMIVGLFFLLGSTGVTYAKNQDPLFVNLTTDDSHRAKMGITLGKNQQGLGHPLTIFLNDKAVSIASKNSASRFFDHQKMLNEIIEEGGDVFVCPVCMDHYGIKQSDLMNGFKIGNPNLIGEMLFRNNTKTLTW